MDTVFPTCVGVFPCSSTVKGPWSGLPHVRGGVSTKEDYYRIRSLSSPRAWGCFQVRPLRKDTLPVFPTCVGVFLRPCGESSRGGCLPHVRGGVSALMISIQQVQIVFPTCVGVFLIFSASSSLRRGLPHVRGGVSSLTLYWDCGDESSPRAWGCFTPQPKPHMRATVFPTCVGVFRNTCTPFFLYTGLPHVRGGVSA